MDAVGYLHGMQIACVRWCPHGLASGEGLPTFLFLLPTSPFTYCAFALYSESIVLNP